MPIDRETIRKTVCGLMPSAQEFLRRLIAFPSTSGKEHDLLCWAEEEFRQLGLEVQRVPLADSLREDEDYSSPVADIRYEGRFNLRLRLPGSGGGKRLLLNSHVDVVPPSQGQQSPWQAIERDGVVYGRGACDAKGQVATIYLVLAALRTLDAPLAGDVIAHVVNEEENGGNGTLAMVRAGETADACIVLEPSTNKIFSSVRGAVWFRILCQGKAGHSGRAGDTVSALGLARKAMDLFETYHDDLLAASRGIPLFDKYENPMPITFGRCIDGELSAEGIHATAVNFPAVRTAMLAPTAKYSALPALTPEQAARWIATAIRRRPVRIEPWAVHGIRLVSLISPRTADRLLRCRWRPRPATGATSTSTSPRCSTTAS